ncbi:hypothetical protein GQ55_1G013500 [Panicum hallii var. hallii]|uniref:GDSL esterase/lipase n=1 Tax=Panicum hallii var. hallii TaxID=1504633 RepID=A0A2T7F0Z9_9POAL|nr:hypothetical protein GQ55_1G013500 [Panicum hallii var. hallii]
MAVRRAAALLHRMLLLAAVAAASVVAGAKVPSMYVFGDSTADVGNNDYLPWSIARADFPHNGVDFPGGKPTGRFSNGLIGVDFIAIAMGANAANSSSEATRNMTMAAAAAYTTGANFASGGSGLLDSTHLANSVLRKKKAFSKCRLRLPLWYTSNLKDQMSTRLGTARVSAWALLSKSIFLVSAGANDAFDFFSQNRSLDSTVIQQFSEAMISTYDSHVKTLYNLGARKFAVINVPLIGCYPYLRSQNPSGECVDALNQLAKSLNDGIRELFSNLSSEMHELLATSFSRLEEVKSACCVGGRFNAERGCIPSSNCCSDRSKYLFWDLVHPTQATYKFAGLVVYDGPAQFVSPISIKQLVEA